jgi:hypothetical protein
VCVCVCVFVCVCVYVCVSRVGHTCVYVHRIRLCIWVIHLPKIPCIHRIYIHSVANQKTKNFLLSLVLPLACVGVTPKQDSKKPDIAKFLFLLQTAEFSV